MKEHWKLIRKSGNWVIWNGNNFGSMEILSKGFIRSGKDKDYQIKYYIGGELIETVELDVYFN